MNAQTMPGLSKKLTPEQIFKGMLFPFFALGKEKMFIILKKKEKKYMLKSWNAKARKHIIITSF